MGKSERTEIRNSVFAQIGEMAGALGSSERLKIIFQLIQSPKTVVQLSELTLQNYASTSQHLQRLRKDGLVQVEKQGTSRIYSLTSRKVGFIFELLQDLAHEVDPKLDRQEDAIVDLSLYATIGLKDILKKVDAQKAVLIDVREEVDFQFGSVEQAISVPLSQVSQFLSQIKTNKELYFFCRGRYCGMASDAVHLARKKGFVSYRIAQSAFRLQFQQRSKEKKTWIYQS